MIDAAKQALLDIVVDSLPGTAPDIAARTRLGRTTVWRWLKRLHAAGKTHIVAWRRTPGGGPFVPLYVAGRGVDVRCHLKPFNVKQRSHRYHFRTRTDGRWLDMLSRMRARYWMDKRVDFRSDPLLAALFPNN